MEPLVQSDLGLLVIVFASAAAVLLLQKVKFFSYFGPAVAAIVLGILLSNFKIVPHQHQLTGFYFTYGVPLILVFFLLEINLKVWLKTSGRSLLSMGIVLVSVCISAIISGLIFAPKLPEGWKIGGMLVGTYTGGSVNLAAIGIALEAKAESVAIATGVDYVIGLPIACIFFLLPGIYAKSKKKFWPKHFSQEFLTGGADEKEFLGRNKISSLDLCLLFAIGFVVILVSTLISRIFSGMIAGSVQIILITTFTIIVAQLKPVKKISGHIEVAFFVSMQFFVIIGMLVNIPLLFHTASIAALYCFIFLLLSIILHFGISRIVGLEFELTMVSSMASFGSAEYSSVIAASSGWKNLISTGVILAAIGLAFGNYLGIGIGYILKALVGG